MAIRFQWTSSLKPSYTAHRYFAELEKFDFDESNHWFADQEANPSSKLNHRSVTIWELQLSQRMTPSINEIHYLVFW